MPAKMMLAAAVSLVLMTAGPNRHRKRKQLVQPAASSRYVRLRRAALLSLRHEMLHDFLVQTGTETPAFRDARTVIAGGGLRIGPTLVEIDFLGAPIVRARVRNASVETRGMLVTARLHDARGATVQASIWIDRLRAGESRTIELFCPAPLHPTSIDWSVNIL